MKILITICARGGSKGVPGKNIKPIGNMPLIAYTINHAKLFASEMDACISLSTDNDKILSVAAEYGLKTNYVRPAELATDDVGKVSVIYDLLLYEEERKKEPFDLILDLDITSPLRTVDDLHQALQILQNHEEALNLFSVNKANRNPYFTMVEEQSSGYFDLCKRSNTEIMSRQKAPTVYELNGSFYFYRREFFAKGHNSVYSGKSLIYAMPHICFDIDEPMDFEFLDYLIMNNRLDFLL